MAPATTPEDEAATTPEDEAIAGDVAATDEFPEPAGVVAATDALTVPAGVVAATDAFTVPAGVEALTVALTVPPRETLMLGMSDELREIFWDEVGGRMLGTSDELSEIFWDDVGTGNDELTARSNEEVTFCDVTVVNMKVWIAKKAKIKRSCFILKS